MSSLVTPDTPGSLHTCLGSFSRSLMFDDFWWISGLLSFCVRILVYFWCSLSSADACVWRRMLRTPSPSARGSAPSCLELVLRSLILSAALRVPLAVTWLTVYRQLQITRRAATALCFCRRVSRKASSVRWSLLGEKWFVEQALDELLPESLLVQRKRPPTQPHNGAKHSPHVRTPEIHQKSSKIDDFENEPGHVWRLPRVSRVTRNQIWHYWTA